MKILTLLMLCLAGTNLYAQKSKSPESFAKSITAADLKKHLYIVAGPEMEGRETATEGQRRAATYIESQFRTIGLMPGYGNVYQMMFPVYQDSLVAATLEVNGKAFSLDTDFNPAISTNADVSLRFSEVLYLGTSAPTDSVKNMNLAGRLILYAGNAPQGRGAGNALVTLILSKGPAAILFIQGNYPKAPASRKAAQSANLFKRTQSPQLYTISPAVASAITGQASTGSTNIRSFDAQVLLETRKSTINLQSSNVVGVLPGTDLKDQYLFITAHYDHLGKRGDSVIYYGADDDGSGTVGIMEIAEAFVKAKAAGKGPRRTLVFMAVSGEEKGLWGSSWYAEHPLFPMDKTTADLNIDMIGRSDTTRKGDTTNYVYVVGDDKLSSDLRKISEGANKKYTRLDLDYKFNDPNDPTRIYFRSDHYNFARKGVPIIFYYDGMLKGDYHKPTDTPDKINYPLLARRAQLVFYTAWEMANRNEMLKRDIPLDPASMTR